MGLYKYLKNVHPLMNRLVEIRKDPSIVRINKPSNLRSAHSLGYKAKQGYILARVKLKRGGRKREKIRHGRRSAHFGRKKIVNKNYQLIAEERAAKKFKNCVVLNSYKVAQDGIYYWFEVILVNPQDPSIQSSHTMGWILQKKHHSRVFHAKTSAGKKSRMS